MRRGIRRLVADREGAEQRDDAVVYRAIEWTDGGGATIVRRSGTSDRFPRYCRAPRTFLIYRTASGAARR